MVTPRNFYLKPFIPFLTVLFMFFLQANVAVAQTSSQTSYCSAIFSTGIQTHGAPDSRVDFDFNARLTAKPGTLGYLNTATTSNHPASFKRSCGWRCYATGTVLEKREPDNFLVTNTIHDVTVPRKKSVTLGKDNQTHFNKVQSAEWSEVTFSATQEAYIIDQLHLGYKSSLKLSAGQYWIRHLQMEPESRIEVIGEGTVNLYVQDALTIPFQAKINAGTRNATRLSIYSGSDITFDVNTQTYAFIIASNQVNLGHAAQITGGVLGQYVQLHTESEVVFDRTGSQLIHFNELCSAELPLNTDVDPPTMTIDPFEYPSPTQVITITGTVMDSGRNASGIASVRGVRSDDGEVFYGVVNGNRFSIDIPLQLGPYLHWIFVTDAAGNESSELIDLIYPPWPVMKNVMPESGSTFTTPRILITGELHAAWPKDYIGFVLNSNFSDLEISEPADGVYFFQVYYTLQPGRNEIHIGAAISPDLYAGVNTEFYYTPSE